MVILHQAPCWSNDDDEDMYSSTKHDDDNVTIITRDHYDSDDLFYSDDDDDDTDNDCDGQDDREWERYTTAIANGCRVHLPNNNDFPTIDHDDRHHHNHEEETDCFNVFMVVQGDESEI